MSLRGLARIAGPCAALGLAAGLVDALRVLGPSRTLDWGLWGLAAECLRDRAAVGVAVGMLVAVAAWAVRPALGSRLGRRWPLVAAACAAVVVGLQGHLMLREARADGPDVVFLGVDTLRADHLGVYGYERQTSPRLDAWAERATVFDRCIASTPRTTQSLASILTGRYPQRTGVRYLSDRLPDTELSLPRVLQDAGYRTIAVLATGIVEGKLEQGFDLVIDTATELAAADAVDLALAALEETPGRYFLFLFLRDPHMPYEPPGVVFDRDYRGPAWKRLHYQGDKGEAVFRNDFAPRLREHAVALYDSEIHHMDREIGRLLEAVEARDRDRLVVFFADHGESLGEHDYYYDHGDLLYQPGLRIPCIVEGIELGRRRVGELVRSVDLMPTVLGALGIRPRGPELDGVDLARDPPPLEAYSETGRALQQAAFDTGRRHLPGLEGRLRSLIHGGIKLIYVPRPGGYELEIYDLDRDPGELHDLAAEGGHERLERRLVGWVEEDRGNWSRPEKELTEEQAERLRMLGYL